MADAVAENEAREDVVGSSSGAVSLRDVLNVHQIARSDIFVGVSIKSEWCLQLIFHFQLSSELLAWSARTARISELPLCFLAGMVQCKRKQGRTSLSSVHKHTDANLRSDITTDGTRVIRR